MIDNELETELRGVFARAGADVEVPPQATERLVRRRYHRRSVRRKVAAGITAAAVVAGGTATALATLGPANHQPTVQLAAWTVVTEPNGNVVIRIRELRHPGRLQHKLRADGIPASVSSGFHQNPSCRRYHASRRRVDKVFPISQTPPRTIRLTIHPAALPKGAGVQLYDGAAGRIQQGKSFSVGIGLVHVSRHCTGR